MLASTRYQLGSSNLLSQCLYQCHHSPVQYQNGLEGASLGILSSSSRPGMDEISSCDLVCEGISAEKLYYMPDSESSQWDMNIP